MVAFLKMQLVLSVLVGIGLVLLCVIIFIISKTLIYGDYASGWLSLAGGGVQLLFFK